MALFAIIVGFVGITWAPLAVYIEWDPIFVVLNNHFPNVFQDKLAKITILAFRYFLTHWCILEGTRLYMLVLIPVIIVGNSYLAIVSQLGKMELGNKVIVLYSALHCTNQIGQQTYATILGLLMGAGVMLLVTLNYVLISSWSLLPIGVYALCVNMAILAYSLMSQIIPIVVKSNEHCVDILNSWQHSIYQRHGCSRYWTKKVRAQRPVAFHYCYTKFDRSTKRNFYSEIVGKTISLVLL